MFGIEFSSSSSLPSKLFVVDQNSKFGVFVNGQLLPPQTKKYLAHNDLVELGRTRWLSLQTSVEPMSTTSDGSTSMMDSTSHQSLQTGPMTHQTQLQGQQHQFLSQPQLHSQPQGVSLQARKPPSEWEKPTVALVVKELCNTFYLSGFSTSEHSQLVSRIVSLGGGVVEQFDALQRKFPLSTCSILVKECQLNFPFISSLISGINILSESYLSELEARKSIDQPLASSLDHLPRFEKDIPLMPELLYLSTIRQSLFNNKCFVTIPQSSSSIAKYSQLIHEAGGQILQAPSLASILEFKSKTHPSDFNLSNNNYNNNNLNIGGGNQPYFKPIVKGGPYKVPHSETHFVISPALQQAYWIHPYANCKDDFVSNSPEVINTANYVSALNSIGIVWTYPYDIIKSIVLASISPYLQLSFSNITTKN